jgi:hypothetical protein
VTGVAVDAGLAVTRDIEAERVTSATHRARSIMNAYRPVSAMEMESSPGARKNAVFMTACRGSFAGVTHRVRQERLSWVWLHGARVGRASRQPLLRSVRA